MTGQERSACSPDLTRNSSLPPSLARDDDSIYIFPALQKTGKHFSNCKAFILRNRKTASLYVVKSKNSQDVFSVTVQYR